MRTRLLPLLLLLGPVAAQDEDLPPDEVADIVERYLERGVESLREGNYEEACEKLAESHRLVSLGLPKRRQKELGLNQS